jgi:cytochrome c553
VISRFLKSALTAGLIAMSAGALAQGFFPLTVDGNAARGEILAYTCTGCHGIDSAVNAYPSYHVPKLGGQNADYIEVALQGYRAGARSHATMQAQSATLTDQDIADLAAYFAAVEDRPATGVYSASAEDIAMGEQASMTCQSCHGTDGIALGAQWPNLAGQHGSYLLESMRQYQRSERTDPTMVGFVSTLDDKTLEQLAAYYASLAGLYQTGR